MFNPVPIYEAKNKLPFFIHLSEKDGIVPITRRNKIVAYIISSEEYEEITSNRQKKKSVVQTIHDSRTDFGLSDDDDFDYTGYFDSLRDRNYYGRPEGNNVFEGI